MGTVALLLGPLINAVLIAVIARRLLGAPVGWPRTLVIAISVSVLANPLLRWIVDRLALATDGGPGASAASVLVIAATIASLVAVEVGIMVVLEALVPSGSLPGPVDVARALPARWRRTKRYAVILRIAGRHGLARYLSPRASRGDSRPASATADSLGVALTEGGVTFVKLGQMLSTRPDLIGPEYAAALSRLHSEVAPQAWPKVQQTLEAELGGPIHEFFEHLEETRSEERRVGKECLL